AELSVERIFVGRYLTALEMPGVSISCLRVDEELLGLLDAPSSRWLPGHPPAELKRVAVRNAEPKPSVTGTSDPVAIQKLMKVLDAIEVAEDQLTELDRIVGDGDIGINLARGARAVRAEKLHLERLDPGSMLAAVAEIVRREVGGTSGALYGAGILAAAGAKRGGASWEACLLSGAEKVAELGRS